MHQPYHQTIRFDCHAQEKCSRSSGPSSFQLQQQCRWSGLFACWGALSMQGLQGWQAVRIWRRVYIAAVQMLHLVTLEKWLRSVSAGLHHSIFTIWLLMLWMSKETWSEYFTNWSINALSCNIFFLFSLSDLVLVLPLDFVSLTS